MPEIVMKEVYFNKYCESCKYLNVEEVDEPCNACLTISHRENSHKPEFFEEK